VLLGRLRAGFVSHEISLSGTLCLPPLQTRVGVSEHPTSIGRVEAKLAIVMRCAVWHQPSSRMFSND